MVHVLFFDHIRSRLLWRHCGKKSVNFFNIFPIYFTPQLQCDVIVVLIKFLSLQNPLHCTVYKENFFFKIAKYFHQNQAFLLSLTMAYNFFSTNEEVGSFFAKLKLSYYLLSTSWRGCNFSRTRHVFNNIWAVITGFIIQILLKINWNKVKDRCTDSSSCCQQSINLRVLCRLLCHTLHCRSVLFWLEVLLTNHT